MTHNISSVIARLVSWWRFGAMTRLLATQMGVRSPLGRPQKTAQFVSSATGPVSTSNLQISPSDVSLEGIHQRLQSGSVEPNTERTWNRISIWESILAKIGWTQNPPLIKLHSCGRNVTTQISTFQSCRAAYTGQCFQFQGKFQCIREIWKNWMIIVRYNQGRKLRICNL